MVKHTKQIESLEALIEYALRHRDSNTRWELSHYSNTVWDDNDAGMAWWNELNAARDAWVEAHRWTVVDYESAEYLAYEAKVNEIIARRPAEHTEHRWSLTSKYGSLALTVELGELIDSVWTKRQTSRYSSTKSRVGQMTLNGILKRLGQSDIAERVATAQAQAKAREAAYIRNNRRDYIRKQAAELHAYILGNLEVTGGETDLAALMALQDEPVPFSE
jgi:hypothetical protein